MRITVIRITVVIITRVIILIPTSNTCRSDSNHNSSNKALT